MYIITMDSIISNFSLHFPSYMVGMDHLKRNKLKILHAEFSIVSLQYFTEQMPVYAA